MRQYASLYCDLLCKVDTIFVTITEKNSFMFFDKKNSFILFDVGEFFQNLCLLKITVKFMNKFDTFQGGK